jgi:hypothetical protein
LVSIVANSINEDKDDQYYGQVDHHHPAVLLEAGFVVGERVEQRPMKVK